MRFGDALVLRESVVTRNRRIVDFHAYLTRFFAGK
jgi:hypothetical protein